MSNLHPIFGQILDNVQKASAVVANATTKPDRCVRHRMVRKGGQPWDAEDPAYYECSRCHITADEIEVEIAELREASTKYTEEINAETERADNAEVAAKLNAQTIADQQRAVRKLESELAEALARNKKLAQRVDELMRAQLELITQRDRARDEAEREHRLYLAISARLAVMVDDEDEPHEPSAAEIECEAIGDSCEEGE